MSFYVPHLLVTWKGYHLLLKTVRYGITHMLYFQAKAKCHNIYRIC